MRKTHDATAPGGYTIAGLLALEDGRVRSTIARAIQVATDRARALGQRPESLSRCDQNASKEISSNLLV